MRRCRGKRKLNSMMGVNRLFRNGNRFLGLSNSTLRTTPHRCATRFCTNVRNRSLFLWPYEQWWVCSQLSVLFVLLFLHASSFTLQRTIATCPYLSTSIRLECTCTQDTCWESVFRFGAIIRRGKEEDKKRFMRIRSHMMKDKDVIIHRRFF